MPARLRRRLEAGPLEMIEQIEPPFRLGRTGQQRMQMLGEYVLPIGNRLEPLAVRVLQGEDHADPDALIDIHHRFKMAFLERIERQHVLDGGHAGAKAFERAEQRACPHLLDRTRRILRRQRIEPPCLEWHLLERALRQHVV